MEKINLVDLQKRKLKKCYIAVYIITKDIKIRNETCITNKKLNVVFGLDILGDRQILGIYFDNENNNRFWLERFEDFHARDVKEILFFITPQNRNIERCIKIIYNDVKIIHSPDDMFESLTRFLADHPSRKMKVALKDLFLAEDIERYKMNYEMFKDVYVENRIIMIMLNKEQKNIEKFYEYKQELRKLFYPFYTIHEMKKFLNKLNTKEPLCSNINEVIEFCMPYVNSFEIGRNYSKKEWLELISSMYEEYEEKMEEYLNV